MPLHGHSNVSTPPMHGDAPGVEAAPPGADGERPGLLGALFSPRGEVAAAGSAGVLLLLGWILHAGMGIPGAAVLYWVSLGIGLIHGGRAAWESARERQFDIDMLMVVGAVLAAYVNQPAEGALLLFLFVLAGGLEGLAMARTKRAVEALHRLIPEAALRWDDGRREWLPIKPAELATGDRVKVLPGEVIPTDAAMEVGDSAINQASLTGESMPRIVRPGDELYAGTINVGNPIEVRVLRPASESSLQRIMNQVLTAQSQREPVQRVIDKLSQPYALSVMGISIGVLLVWWLVFGEPLVGEPDGGNPGALYTAITLLVVMSPCAVIISTPTATLAAIARAARAGVLFKGGQSIERLARMRVVAMDKTGTLTIGRPKVQQVHPVGWSDAHELLAVAAGLEQDSTHPIAAAIREAAATRGVEPMHATRATFQPGRGVSGVFEGVPARLGSYEHTEDLVPVCLRMRVREVLARVQERGQMATVIAWDGQAGVIIMHDEPRPGAHGLAAELEAMDVRPAVMLTGDNRATAEAAAAKLGIREWKAELLPEGKVAELERLKREHRARGGVGVIGDGVNDAPALTAADVSIAIGSIGSDAALESADIVLLGDDLSSVPWAVRLARRTRVTIAANLIFALTAIAVMAVLTVVGSRLGYHFPLWVGVLGHEGGTLLVVANSLLLLTVRRRVGSRHHTDAPGEHAPGGAAPARIPVGSATG